MTIFAGLLHNAALLVAMVVVLDLMISRYKFRYWPQQVVTGLILGIMPNKEVGSQLKLRTITNA